MLNDREPEQFREVSCFKQVWKMTRQDKPALISLYLFVLLCLFIFIGHLISPYAVDAQFIGLELLPPSWEENGKIEHFLGTDNLGRDIFSRLLHGFYYTVGSALCITVIIAFLGGAIGIVAGTKKESSFFILSHLFDTFLFTPVLLIAIVIATLMTPSLMNAMLAIFLALLPHFIHRIYRTTRQEMKQPYTVAMLLDGAKQKELIRWAILPNLSVVAVKELSHIFVIAVLDISALSFITLGAKENTPEWGAMILDSMDLIYIAPWAVILPGLAIVFSIAIITLFGHSVVRILQKYHH